MRAAANWIRAGTQAQATGAERMTTTRKSLIEDHLPIAAINTVAQCEKIGHAPLQLRQAGAEGRGSGLACGPGRQRQQETAHQVEAEQDRPATPAGRLESGSDAPLNARVTRLQISGPAE